MRAAKRSGSNRFLCNGVADVGIQLHQHPDQLLLMSGLIIAGPRQE